MKIVVFGGAGFLGSHVADVLTDSGNEVVIFDLKKSPYLKKGQKEIISNILERDMVKRAIEGAEVVYNFAGIADLIDAKKNPLETVQNNILGNTILLDASAKIGIRRFIFASSVYVYSRSGSFYRSSKQACELLTENYSEAYKLDFTILRYGSLYGPRANESNWIYDILKEAILYNRITRKGDGEELREYIHVFDAARLSVDILNEKYKNQYVIISGNQAIKIRDLLIMIREMLENKVEIKFSPVDYNEHYKITPYVFRPNLAQRLTGNHYVDLGQGILDMINEIYAKEKGAL